LHHLRPLSSPSRPLLLCLLLLGWWELTHTIQYPVIIIEKEKNDEIMKEMREMMVIEKEDGDIKM